MPVQTSSDYTAAHVAAYEGQRVELGLQNIDSKTLETGTVPFGRAVIVGSSDSQCLLAGATGRFLGISCYTTAGLISADGEHEYQRYREVDFIDFGKVYVRTETAVVDGDPVYFRRVATGDELLGAFRNTSDGGDCELIPGASFRKDVSADEITVVDLKGTSAAPVSTGVEKLVAQTAISTEVLVTVYNTTGAVAATLADGFESQRKIVKLDTDGGTVTITPTNLMDGTTITLADTLDSVELVFAAGEWMVVSNVGSVVA